MKDDNKTKKQLVHELTELRSQNATMKKSINGSISAELAAEEARLYAESIVETVREPLLLLDADLKIISANRNFYRTFIVTPGETIGSFIYDLGNKQWDIPKLRELLETILPEKATFDNYEVEHDFATIGRRIMLLNARQIIRVSGKERIILLAIEDITGRREIEALRRSEERYRTIMEETENSYFEVDLAGNFTFINDAACRHLRYSREESIGMNYRVHTPPEDVKKVLQTYNQVYRTGEPVECFSREMIRKDGSRIFTETSIFPLRNERGEIIGFRGVGCDVTERKQVEEKLAKSEAQYRRLFEAAQDGILILDGCTGQIIDVNPFLINMLGYRREDFLGKCLWEIGPFKDVEAAKAAFQELQEKAYIRYEDLPLETKDGQQVQVEFVSNSYFAGQTKVIQCNIRDITDRKRLEAAKVEVERMKTQFISNVSHELRTPLQSIKGFTKLMLQGKVPDPETQKEFLTMVDRESENLCGLIENLLDMSRIEFGRFDINIAPVSIRDLIHNVVHGFYSLAKNKSIVITEDMAAALPEIEADEERLRQVMVNLLSNAIKFSKDGGKITVKAEAEDGKVLVQVTDHGIGIPEASMEHLFEKFYQGDGSITRSYGGSGLGLYISKQIIEAHGGSIWSESKLGKETTLAFVIPRASQRGCKKIGEIMVEDGLISEQDLAEALKKQESQK